MPDDTPAYRDSHGRTLTDYPRPSVAVDTAVLTVADGTLCVLLTPGSRAHRTSGWALPGTFLHPGETLREAALRALRTKAGVDGLDPRQLHVFDAPDRDDRGWVLSVAHVDAVRADRIPRTATTRIVPVAEVPPLPYDHRAILDAAVDDLRAEHAARPDPRGLLGPEPFTVRDLRVLHEAVTGERVNADTFRRTMLPGLRATGELRRGARGKPAELFVRA